MRRPVVLATALLALALPAPASAIVAGDPVAPGEFPSQGFLGVDTDGNGHIDSVCGGTLVGSRQFLTAARCTTNFIGHARTPTSLTVQVGDVTAPGDTLVQDVADNDIPESTEVPGGYVKSTGENDVAMLTLKAPLHTELTRVVDRGEGVLWPPGTAARVLGWGETSQGGDISETLRKGTVVIRADDDCGAGFDPAIMLCAAGTPATGSKDPCASDSGSPLLVPDGRLFAVAGVFSGTACSTADAPGRYARLGDDPLNKWVHDRTPEANFTFENGLQPHANVPFALVSTSHDPEGPNYFTRFRWDLDNDGSFDDATGKRIVTSVGSPGEAVVGIEASRPAAGSTPEGDTASAYFAFDVGADPNAPGGGQPTPPAANPALTPVAPPLATILAAKRPKVKRGRFAIRIRFAKAAPSGTAVIEVYRGTRRIGIARTKVKRGATKRVRVKLTPTGRRLLRRSATRRLKIRIRVRVGRQVLRTKRLTIQRLR